MIQAQSEFAGRVALVTGGGSGIGAEICRRLVEMGAQVAIGDCDVAAAERLKAELKGQCGAALALQLDVTDPASIANAVNLVQDQLGSLTLCANNAGIVTPRRDLADIQPSEWSRQLAVNLTGVFNCLQAELPALVAAGGGAVVNMSSLCGVVGVAGTGAYTAAKHGVIGLTKAAALDYATRGIRVNAIAPGYVDTPMLADRGEKERRLIAERHPVNRMATPREIADAVCYLLSHRSSFITGAVLNVDGGYTAR